MQSDDGVSRASRPPAIPRYWTLQIGGWAAFAAFSYFSLNVWYNPGELIPALHTILQSALGIFVSHPLRWIARAEWDNTMTRRVFVNGGATLVAALVWTALRLEAFTLMTGETIGLDDWGGWIFGSVTVFASWSFSYHALKYYRQWIEQREQVIFAEQSAMQAKALAQEENLKRLQAESLARDATLRMLKYQLNPHFLFNALNSVSALVARGSKDGAMEMLARIADFLRITLDEENPISHSLQEEIDIIDLYFGIEKVRFGSRLNVEFAIDDSASAALVPTLILQPIVENCVKYAVGGTSSPVAVRISASVAESRLRIMIEDDGPGAAAKPAGEVTSHIGLNNVRSRLATFSGGDFALDARFGAERGFVVALDLPCYTEVRRA